MICCLEKGECPFFLTDSRTKADVSRTRLSMKATQHSTRFDSNSPHSCFIQRESVGQLGGMICANIDVKTRINPLIHKLANCTIFPKL